MSCYAAIVQCGKTFTCQSYKSCFKPAILNASHSSVGRYDFSCLCTGRTCTVTDCGLGLTDAACKDPGVDFDLTEGGGGIAAVSAARFMGDRDVAAFEGDAFVNCSVIEAAAVATRCLPGNVAVAAAAAAAVSVIVVAATLFPVSSADLLTGRAGDFATGCAGCT